MAGFPAMVTQLEAEARRIGTYRAGAATPQARALDEQSASDWIAANVPGGGDSLLGRAVGADMTGSFGLDPRDLSAITLSRCTPAPRRVRRSVSTSAAATTRSRASSRRRCPSARCGRFGDAGSARTSSGRFEMLIDRYRKPVKADVIVLAQPLPALREADLSGVPLPAAYRRMIAGLGMGTNAKLMLGLQRRPPATATGPATCSPTIPHCRPGTARSPSAPRSAKAC